MWIQNDSIRKTVIPIRKTQQVECLWRTLKTTPSYLTITVGEYFLVKEKLKRHCSLVSIEGVSQLAHNFSIAQLDEQEHHVVHLSVEDDRIFQDENGLLWCN